MMTFQQEWDSIFELMKVHIVKTEFCLLSETSGLKRLCTAYDCQDCPVNCDDETDIEDSDYDFSDDDIPAGIGFYF